LVAIQVSTSLDELGKEVQIEHARKYLSFGRKKIVKIGPVDPQIVGSSVKKEITEGKYIAWSASLPSSLETIEAQQMLKSRDMRAVLLPPKCKTTHFLPAYCTDLPQ